MTEMQSDFEDWLSVNAPCVSDYEKQHIEWLMWQAWQASRAALVVKLPISVCRTHVFEIKGSHEVGMEHDEYFEISDVTKSLDAAGVSYE